MATSFYDVTSKTLGRGHYGPIKLARHTLTGEPVAIKIIEKLRLDRESLCQLGTEISILFRLSEYEHPNILRLYQVIDTKTKLHLVNEYCGPHACDLYQYIFNKYKYKKTGLNEMEAKHIFIQICSAIDYCHSLNIVHRDLKPESILVTEQQHTIKKCLSGPLIKFTDFGFAKQSNSGEKMTTPCGTMAYSAPEILLGEMYDGRKVDFWGLGILLYILLFGRNPFIQMNDNETLTRIMDCSFIMPQETDISDNGKHLINSLIRRDPDSRLTVYQILDHPWMETMPTKELPVILNDHSRNQKHTGGRDGPQVRRPSTKLRLSSSSSAVAGSSMTNYPSKVHDRSNRQRPVATGGHISTNINGKGSNDKFDEDEYSSTSFPINTRSRSLSGEEKQTFCEESSSPMSNVSCSSLGRSHKVPRKNYRPTSPDIGGVMPNDEERCMHDYIVGEMMPLGYLCESKGAIEQSLREARLSSRRFFNPSIVNEVSGVRIADMRVRPDCGDSFTKSVPRSRSRSFKIFNDEYVNATYQLLRDRALRDGHNMESQYKARTSLDSLETAIMNTNNRSSSFIGGTSNSLVDGGIVRSKTERFDSRHSMGDKSFSSAASLSSPKAKHHQQEGLRRRQQLQPQNKLKDKFTSFFRGGSLTGANDNELNDQFYTGTTNLGSDDNMLKAIELDTNEALASSKTAGLNIFKQASKKPARAQDSSVCEPSRASLTHEWKILKTPNRCQECNLYVYFNGCECNLCGFVAHKKCVTVLVIKCSGQKLSTRQRVTTPIFGQPLKTQVIDFVKRFVHEIDTRGLRLKGIYRVSSVKSKVDKLCSSYDQNANLVDLSSFHPNIVANALKLYLRQLPEPLLTFKLYQSFVAIAKKCPASSQHLRQCPDGISQSSTPTDPLLIVEMRQVVELLPNLNKEIVAIILRHLKRVADMSDQNQMTASNLSIVFGPTLLNSNDSNTFVDTVHQSRVVELLINWVEQIFPQYTTYKSTAVIRLNLSEMRRQFFVSSTAVGN